MTNAEKIKETQVNITILEKLIDHPAYLILSNAEFNLFKTKEYQDYLRMFYGDISHKSKEKYIENPDVDDIYYNSILHSSGYIRNNLIQKRYDASSYRFREKHYAAKSD